MRLFILVTAIMVMAITPAFSQSLTPQFEIGVGGGMNMPTGNVGDTMSNGYAFNAFAGYRVLPILTLGAEFGFYGNGATDETLQLTGASSMDTRIMQFTGTAKVSAPVASVHSVYAKGAMGMYNVKQSFEGVALLGSGDVSDTKFGAGAGAGFQLNSFSKASVYIEGMFHNVFGDTEDLRFFSVGAGVVMPLP